MGIKHAYQSATADNPSAEISSGEWNADHSIDSALPLPLVASPSAAAADTTNLYATKLAQCVIAGMRGPSGKPLVVQPYLGRARVAWWHAIAGSTSVSAFGFAIGSSLGTATAKTLAATNAVTRRARLQWLSSATAGNLAGPYGANTVCLLGDGSGNNGFLYTVRWNTDDAASVSGARMFVGLSPANTPTNVEPSTLINTIGVAQLSTDATQMYLVYGGSAAQTPIALGTNFDPTVTTDTYELVLYSPSDASGTVYYQLTRLGTGATTSGTLTGNSTVLPTATPIAPVQWRCNNATALAVALSLNSIFLLADI